jgi:hypothetical protein
MKPQVLSVKNTTDLLLITVGANDLGLFLKLARSCLWFTRTAGACSKAIASTVAALPAVEQDLVDTFLQLAEHMGLPREGGTSRKIVLVGYPHCLLDDPFELHSLLGDSIDLPQTWRSMEEIQSKHWQQAVDRANLLWGQDVVHYYNKTTQVFAGHEINPSMIQRNPVGYTWEFGEILSTPWEMYHINPAGHEALAAALALEGTFGVSGRLNEGINRNLR